MSDHVLTVLNKIDVDEENYLTGEVLGLKDVYERQITKELLRAKRHSEVILKNMSEGILELNLDGKILYANPLAISLCDIPEDNLLTSHFSELFEEPHRRRIKDNLLTDEAGHP